MKHLPANLYLFQVRTVTLKQSVKGVNKKGTSKMIVNCSNALFNNLNKLYILFQYFDSPFRQTSKYRLQYWQYFKVHIFAQS